MTATEQIKARLAEQNRPCYLLFSRVKATEEHAAGTWDCGPVIVNLRRLDKAKAYLESQPLLEYEVVTVGIKNKFLDKYETYKG